MRSPSIHTQSRVEINSSLLGAADSQRNERTAAVALLTLLSSQGCLERGMQNLFLVPKPRFRLRSLALGVCDLELSLREQIQNPTNKNSSP